MVVAGDTFGGYLCSTRGWVVPLQGGSGDHAAGVMHASTFAPNTGGSYENFGQYVYIYRGSTYTVHTYDVIHGPEASPIYIVLNNSSVYQVDLGDDEIGFAGLGHPYPELYEATGTMGPFGSYSDTAPVFISAYMGELPWTGHGAYNSEHFTVVSYLSGPDPRFVGMPACPTAPVPPVLVAQEPVEPSFPVIRGTSWVGVGGSTATTDPEDDIAEHLAATTDAHDAAAIGYVPTPPVDATSVQDALDAALIRGLIVEELDGAPTDAAISKLVFPNGTLGIASHVVTYTPPAGGGSALTVEELSGTPTDGAVTKIVFPNGTLAIVGGVATYTPAGGGGATLTPVMTTAPNLVTTNGATVWLVLTTVDGQPVVV